MKFGKNLKEIDKLLSEQFPDKHFVVCEQRVESAREFGIFPQTQITIVLKEIHKVKKPSAIQRIKKFFRG